ncbi:MAG: hypothetical protein B7Y41_14135 [Hydrogenophilales bacterium 28-61-23]|nr:MAG: hypothetical protein B7Y41_14135 [Hydrogenophilales bacterium 28-61-23]
MKLHQIAFAVAALAAGSANAAITPTFVIHMDGATAIGNSVTDVAKAMCKNAASTQAYQGGPSNKIKGVYCSDVDTTNSGLAAGTKLWIVKNNVDGSLEAFDRAIKRNAQTLVLDEATCATPTFAGTTLSCTGTKLVNAHGGFSDVEGAIWEARGAFNPAGVAYTTKAGFAGQGFGVAVSDKLYAALQTAQGLGADFTVANQPNITKQQFTSILSSSGAYHTDWTPFGVANATNNLNLCRRTNASGTQAGMEVFFLNNPCAAADPTFGQLNAVLDADTNGSFKVIENAGTGDVKTCLNAHNQNTVNAAVKADGTAADEYAIGIMSLENAPGASDHWHFVKLDGVSPTPDASQRQTVIDGQYNYAFESVYVYRNDNTTAQKNFMNKFVALMGNPAKVNPLVGIFTVPGASSYSAYPARVHRGSTGGNSCSPFSLAE